MEGYGIIILVLFIILIVLISLVIYLFVDIDRIVKNMEAERKAYNVEFVNQAVQNRREINKITSDYNINVTNMESQYKNLQNQYNTDMTAKNALIDKYTKELDNLKTQMANGPNRIFVGYKPTNNDINDVLSSLSRIFDILQKEGCKVSRDSFNQFKKKTLDEISSPNTPVDCNDININDLINTFIATFPDLRTTNVSNELYTLLSKIKILMCSPTTNKVDPQKVDNLLTDIYNSFCY